MFHTSDFLNLFLITLKSKFNIYFTTFVGTFNDLNVNSLPLFSVYFYLILLIAISFLNDTTLKLNLKQKIVSFICGMGMFILIFTVEFILWWQPNPNIITGVQGRYFIPFAPLFFLIFNNLKANNYLHPNEINKYIYIYIYIY
ncbi:MAG: DUF2142 domain-containing protein [Methanobrevibacter sp.]|jgi:uncharacterized membrane protein|nr:DUF2142 domain-containing protein [Candidatus Methanovirga procula]